MMFHSVLAVAWLLCGLVAVVTMLMFLGRVAPSGAGSRLKWMHRIFGGIFCLGYIVFLFWMVPLYQANGLLLPLPFTVHAYLGALLFPLLLIKLLIVRFFRKYYAAIPYLGIIIFAIGFALVGMTGFQNILLRVKGPRVTVESVDGPRTVSVALGRHTVHNKCARCHPLQVIYLYRKPENQWQQTVKRMARKDPGLITEDHADYIVGFLVKELGQDQ